MREPHRRVPAEDAIERLGRAPRALLVRHAERHAVTDPVTGHVVPLTEAGYRDAVAFGERLARGAPVHLSHSPVGRCRQTAEALAEGLARAGGSCAGLEVHEDLGGFYLHRAREALEMARDLGGEGFLRAWFDGALPAGWVLSREETALRHLAALEALTSRHPGALCVAVTHDWNLLAVREEYLGLRHERDGWIGYLDGLALSYESDALVLACRGAVHRPGSASGERGDAGARPRARGEDAK